MTDAKSLGRLITVPVSDVWKDEASQFTPWLARPENIALLGEELRLGKMEVDAVEKRIGDFFADIVARDAGGGLVLVENQLGPTDHSHLGQILTYLAGLEGEATVVWITTRFRDEHRAAIDWLNANTNDQFDFFGIEIELFRIGESAPAPRFNIVAKPNNWSRTNRRISEAPLNEGDRLYLDYWTSYRDYWAETDPDVRLPIPRAGSVYRLPIRSGFYLNGVISRSEKWMRVEVYIQIKGEAPKIALRTLKIDKDAVEGELGYEVSWDEEPDRQATRIAISRRNVDITNSASWREQHAWMLQSMSEFRRVFEPRIRALPSNLYDGSLRSEEDNTSRLAS